MARSQRSLFERVWDVIASWGGPDAIQLSPEEPRGSEIRVTIRVDSGRIHVGSLWQDSGEYVFEYSREFKDQEDLRPISAFRELSRTYRSAKLWPFFSVRIPPLAREDVQQVIAERGLDTKDQFALLVSLGGKTITSPYELELVRHGRRPETRSTRPAYAH